MALSLRLDKNPAHVYVLIGDGELSEGQNWEAAMAAAAFKLDHLVAIVDNNGLQATGRLKDRMDPGDLKAKWAAFGWNVIEIDGHDMKQIVDALDQADLVQGRPTVILAHTVKGKGISFAENVPSFHNGTLTQELYDQAMRELQ